MNKNFKYKASFGELSVQCIADKEKDKYLSKASLDALSPLIPSNIDLSKNPDLLLIAFNSCVVNRVNKNGDVVDSATAVAMAKQFMHKFIDIEHNRSMVIGHIINIGYSKFGSNELMTEEEAAKTTEPYNLCLAGVIYEAVNEQLADDIEESADPDSSLFNSISASWELGFSTFGLAIGSKNLSECQIVTDSQQVASMENMLKCYGGSGKTEDGRYVYRLITGEVLPMGIGLTATPAAEVQGLIVKEDPAEEENEVENPEDGQAKEDKEANTEKSEEINSHSNNANVKSNSMKKSIASIDEAKALNDENIKEYSVANVVGYFMEELKKANDTFVAQNAEKEKSAEELKSQVDELSKKWNEASEKMTKLVEAQEKEAAQSTFDVRMAALDEQYNLDEEDRKVIASQIPNLSDEAFSSWLEQFKTLARTKLKQVQANASQTNKEVAEEVLNKAKESEGKEVIQTIPAAVPSLKEQYEAAFSREGFEITL